MHLLNVCDNFIALNDLDKIVSLFVSSHLINSTLTKGKVLE
jgi:hypothetical protein